MFAAIHPDWTGSPQHFVAGLILAGVIALGLRRIVGWRIWQVALTALLVTMGAEALVELIEYPLLYADRFHATAYYDTVADIADTLAGATLGAVLGAAKSARRY